MDIVSYLSSKGVPIKPAGANNIHVPCFFCGEDPAKRGRLYIATGPTEDAVGLFDCKLCGHRGNLRTLQRHFGDQIDLVDDSHHQAHRVLQEAAKFYADNLHPDVLGWLKRERHLTSEVVDEQQFGWAPSEDRNALYKHLRSKGFETKDILATGLCVEKPAGIRDFLRGVVTIPYLVNGSVVQIRGKDMHGKYVTPPNQKTRLFGTDNLISSEEVVIAEGEFDALLLTQMGYNAVGCPGSNVWQDSWADYFQDARVVYVVFDPDDAGKTGARKIKEQLGHKVKVVHLPVPTGVADKEVDVTWMVQQGATKDTFDELFRGALLANSMLVSVDQAFEEWESVQGVQGLRLGFEELDTAIRPGLLPAQVCVILAKTNTGKTIILLNIFQRVAMLQPDAHILFISLEQTRGDWFERARRIWNFYNLTCPRNEVHQRTLDFWRSRLEIVDRNRISEEDLVACIREYEMKHGRRPDLVAVDYLGYWAAGFKGRDRYEKVTEAVMSLKAVAKGERVAIVAPHQVNRVAEFGQEFEVDQARDSGAVEETADFVFGLWNPDSMKGVAPEDRTGVVQLKVGKSRHGGKGNTIKLQFAPLTLAMVPIEEQAALKLAREELRYVLQRDSWEHAVFRHRTGIQDMDIERMLEAS
jgi:5S rRNA maturation endonuclease (ribonuclease M5)/archaellum biogenesis ATPase FlaH